MRDYLQEALHKFNGGNWYGWKTHDDNGNKIPNSERMQYQHIKIIKDGATMPTEAEVDAKIEELKQKETDKINKSNLLFCSFMFFFIYKIIFVKLLCINKYNQLFFSAFTGRRMSTVDNYNSLWS